MTNQPKPTTNQPTNQNQPNQPNQPNPPKPLTLRHILRAPLPNSPSIPTSLGIRLCTALASRLLIQTHGKQHLHPDNDPFITVLNHNQKLEALYIPCLLMFYRRGKIIHFLADWNFCLIPGVWFFYHYGQVITIARKPAKPKILNTLKPLFTTTTPGFTRAKQTLNNGNSIGLFPEGTTNPQPTTLLKGHTGAAQLSIQTQTPILPIGIQFPTHNTTQPIPELIPITLNIGKPMPPPTTNNHKTQHQTIRQWHTQIMTTIAQLSNKTWPPPNHKK